MGLSGQMVQPTARHRIFIKTKLIQICRRYSGILSQFKQYHIHLMIQFQLVLSLWTSTSVLPIEHLYNLSSARSLVFSGLRSKTKGSGFELGH